jgi:hypothetical protein
MACVGDCHKEGEQREQASEVESVGIYLLVILICTHN